MDSWSARCPRSRLGASSSVYCGAEHQLKQIRHAQLWTLIAERLIQRSHAGKAAGHRRRPAFHLHHGQNTFVRPCHVLYDTYMHTVSTETRPKFTDSAPVNRFWTDQYMFTISLPSSHRPATSSCTQPAVFQPPSLYNVSANQRPLCLQTVQTTPQSTLPNHHRHW